MELENKPSGLAIASMVLGIVSIVLCCCFPMGTMGLILGIVALKKVNDGTGDGKGMAIAGIVLNGICTVAGVINIILNGAAMMAAIQDEMMLLPTLFIK